ncbi:MAG: hypothetical protein K9L28_08230, partial [Synergistales bacterium]|nr:hypothetical protein [Synergistales bacterium]
MHDSKGKRARMAMMMMAVAVALLGLVVFAQPAPAAIAGDPLSRDHTVQENLDLLVMSTGDTGANEFGYISPDVGSATLAMPWSDEELGGMYINKTAAVTYGMTGDHQSMVCVAGYPLDTDNFQLKLYSADVRGSTRFSEKRTYTVGTSPGTDPGAEGFHSHAYDILAADWTGDDTSDYAAVFPSKGECALVTADGASSSQKVRDGIVELDGDYPYADLAALDFNGDGRKELVTATLDNDGTMRLRAFRVAEDLTVTPCTDSHYVADWSRKYDTIAVAGGDSDRDGSDELFVAHSRGDNYCKTRLQILDLSVGSNGEIAWDITHRVWAGGYVEIGKDWGEYTDWLRDALAVADLNGDGRDECCLYTTRETGDANYLRLKVFGVRDGSLQEYAHYDIGPEEAMYLEDENYAALTAGAFGVAFSPYDPEGPVRQIAAHYLKGDASSATLTLLQPTIGSDGSIDGLSKIADTSAGSLPGTMAQLVPGDFGKDGIYLGTPVRITADKHITPQVIVQEPPKHLDYVECFDGTTGRCNLTRWHSYNTTFKDSGKQKDIVTTGQRVSTTFGKTTQASVHAGLDLGVFNASTSMKDTFSHVRTHISSKHKSRYEEESTSFGMATEGGDGLCYRRRQTEIWRYPLIGETGTDGTVYYQVVVPKPVEHTTNSGRKAEWYQPVHVPGNLLTYPWNEQVFGFSTDGAEQLTNENDMGISLKQTETVTWKDNVAESDETKTIVRNSSQKDMSVSMGGIADIFSGGASVKEQFTHDKCSEHSAGSTNSITKTNGFSVEIPNFNNTELMGYGIKPRVYSTDIGVLATTYLVDDSSVENDTWWTDRYGGNPNPALGLPFRWRKVGHVREGPNHYAWTNSGDAPAGSRMRGVFFFDADSDKQLDATIPRAVVSRVRVKCRIYNLSLQEGNVEIPVEIAYSTSPSSDNMTEIGTETVTLNCWGNGTEPNWGWVEATWDVSGLDSGRYYINVQVDPENTIADELPHHDNGETYSDNYGWYEVYIHERYGSGEATARKDAAAGGLRELDGELEVSPDHPFLGRAATIEADIENNGAGHATDVYLTFYDRAPGGTRTVVAEEHIPGIPPGGRRSESVRYFPEVPGKHSVTMKINDYSKEEDDATGSYVAQPWPASVASGDVAPGDGVASMDVTGLAFQRQRAAEDRVQRLFRRGTVLGVEALRGARVAAQLEQGNPTAVYTIGGADGKAATVTREALLAFNSETGGWDLFMPGVTGGAFQVADAGDGLTVAVTDGCDYDSDGTVGKVATDLALLTYQGAAPTPTPAEPTATPLPQPTATPAPTVAPTAVPTATPTPGPVPQPEPVDSGDVTPDEGTVSVDITPVSDDEQPAIQESAQGLLDGGDASSIDKIEATRMEAEIDRPGGKAGFTIGDGNNLAAQADQKKALLVRNASTDDWDRFDPGHSGDDLDVTEGDSGLHVQVKDGGAYDRDGASDGSVETDLAIVTYTAAEPTPSGSGESGCSLGGS